MVEELFTTGNAENVASLPRYLDVRQKLNAPSIIEDVNKGDEWALFRDNDGRVLAQRMKLIKNEEIYLKHAEKCIAGNSEKKNPEYILVVATDYAEENFDTVSKFSKNHDDAAETALTLDDLEGFDSGTDTLLRGKQNIRSLSSNDSYNLEYFPCIRTQWYIQKPLSDSVLVDDTAIVNTTVLANDLRAFLKNNSISLESFAKLYMNRTQGTVSDLLNHPKKWQELSRKGKDTYIKFMEFLSDSNLSINIKEMRSKNSFLCSDKLPSSLITQLEQGIHPNDKDLSNAASMLQLQYDTVLRYCQHQLSIQGDSKTTGYTQSNEHISDVHGKIICGKPGCGTVVQDDAALNLHLEKSCQNQYYCAMCENNFNTKASFDSHIAECQRPFLACTQPILPGSYDDIQKDSLLVGNDVNLESQKYICCVCWSGFKSRQRLTKHLSAKHMVNQKDLRPGVTCFVCFKVLKNLHALDVHMRTHSNDRPFCCDLCTAAFQTKANLQRHIKTHTGEKPYACSYCKSRFIEKKALVIHQRTHTGEKPFRCPICNKCFVHKTPLKLHMLIHEGKKPHTCDKCGKTFRQKINLKVHMKRHSGDKKHKCPTCNLSFLTKTDWNRHNMMHTGEKPFQCQLCSKTFTRNSYLRDHLERLKNVTALQCETCDKRFCNDAALKRHRKSHGLLTSNLLHDRKVNNKDAIVSDTFEYPDVDSDNANMLLLSTKSTVSNDRQYFVTPIQSIEGTSDDINRLSLPSVMLAHSDDGYSIPITGIDGPPLFLHCVDIAGNSAPLFASNGEILSSLKDIAIPITFSTSEDANIENVPSVLEASDPNMHSTVSKNLVDGVILNEDIQNRDPSVNGLELSDEQSSLLVTQAESIHGNPVLVMHHGENDNGISRNHLPVPVCVNDVILAETQNPEISVQSCDEQSKNQTFVVVEP